MEWSILDTADDLKSLFLSVSLFGEHSSAQRHIERHGSTGTGTITASGWRPPGGNRNAGTLALELERSSPACKAQER